MYSRLRNTLFRHTHIHHANPRRTAPLLFKHVDLGGSCLEYLSTHLNLSASRVAQGNARPSVSPTFCILAHKGRIIVTLEDK